MRVMFEVSLDNFDIEQIAVSGQCFRLRTQREDINGAPAVRFFAVASQYSGGEITDRTVSGVQVGKSVSFDCDIMEFAGFWSSYFDLDADYGKFISSVDPDDAYLTASAGSCPGMRILRQDPWEMLITFIISQQNNIPRIKKCVETLCRRYGREIKQSNAAKMVYEQDVVTESVNFASEKIYGFPAPDALAGLTEEDLKSCGLGYRAAYILRAAREVVSGELDIDALAQMDYEKAFARLLRLHGVGIKVANCVCLFGLHHVEAFPVDTHINQILALHYPDGFPFERYQGYAGIMQQYMFYYDLHG